MRGTTSSRETQLQSALVTTIRAQGGYAVKLAHATNIGIPDLMILHKETGPIFVEVKKHEWREKKVLKGGVPFIPGDHTLRLTRMQALTLMKYQQHGATCGVIFIWRIRPQDEKIARIGDGWEWKIIYTPFARPTGTQFMFYRPRLRMRQVVDGSMRFTNSLVDEYNVIEFIRNCQQMNNHSPLMYWQDMEGK